MTTIGTVAFTLVVFILPKDSPYVQYLVRQITLKLLMGFSSNLVYIYMYMAMSGRIVHKKH